MTVNIKDRISTKGFSLMEIILVVVMVAFVIFIIANIPNSISLVGKSRYASLAKDISSQTIESIRLKSYQNLTNGITQINDSRLSALPSGSGTVTVNDCPITICKNGEKTKQVDIQVNWLEGSASKNVLLSTFVSSGGLK